MGPLGNSLERDRGGVVRPQEIEEAVAELAGVDMGEAVGALDVTGADGLDHLLMLIGEQAAVIGAVNVVEVEVQQAAALIQQLFIEAREIGVPAGARDGHVEVLVGLRHGEVVA